LVLVLAGEVDLRQQQTWLVVVEAAVVVGAW
jgi:hypothetical protein